jgi:hypothetical protein
MIDFVKGTSNRGLQSALGRIPSFSIFSSDEINHGRQAGAKIDVPYRIETLVGRARWVTHEVAFSVWGESMKDRKGFVALTCGGAFSVPGRGPMMRFSTRSRARVLLEFITETRGSIVAMICRQEAIPIGAKVSRGHPSSRG